jgi:hypothetical protein
MRGMDVEDQQKEGLLRVWCRPTARSLPLAKITACPASRAARQNLADFSRLGNGSRDQAYVSVGSRLCENADVYGSTGAISEPARPVLCADGFH